MTYQTASLSINGLRLSVFLGVYPAELLKKQTVSLDIQIHFAAPPLACQTDKLEDTYCYDKLVSHIKENTASRRFQLVEHLAQELYALLKHYFPPALRLNVRVTKQPAIADLAEGVTFEYGH